jgi:hypothetical protein
MSGLFDAVLGAIDGNTVNSIARQLGTNPQHAQGAIQAALPLILGAMGRNAADPRGAEALHRAAARDHAGLDLGGVLGSVLGGGGQNIGQSILGHVFGARQERAATGLGKVAGLDGASAAKLMAMLAPIVMNVLGRQTSQRGLDAGMLGGLLGQENQRMQQQSPGAGGLLGAVLDRDGDGDVDFNDLMQVGGGLLGQFMNRR